MDTSFIMLLVAFIMLLVAFIIEKSKISRHHKDIERERWIDTDLMLQAADKLRLIGGNERLSATLSRRVGAIRAGLPIGTGGGSTGVDNNAH